MPSVTPSGLARSRSTFPAPVRPWGACRPTTGIRTLTVGLETSAPSPPPAVTRTADTRTSYPRPSTCLRTCGSCSQRYAATICAGNETWRVCRDSVRQKCACLSVNSHHALGVMVYVAFLLLLLFSLAVWEVCVCVCQLLNNNCQLILEGKGRMPVMRYAHC